VPIIGDFHFNGHTLLIKHSDLADALDKYRVNPGNVGKGDQRDDNFATIIKTAVKYGKAVRIGVNWGSLDKELLSAMMDTNAKAKDPQGAHEMMIEAMLESALTSARYALNLGLPESKLVLSAKLSVLQDLVEVYQRLAASCHHVLHLGLTEAGGGIKGVAASAAALSILLQQGIGDTIRVSITADPGAPRSKEVDVAREILQSMGFRYFMPSVTSCPGCGRTKSAYFRQLAQDVQAHVQKSMPVWKKNYPGVEKLKIAVMGCVVNGPGESRHADIGISLPGSFEDPAAPVYVGGEPFKVLRGEKIREEFIQILEEYIQKKFG
jgi:(E)-4-hydroxy-3-methylbut-2-enyl-diphosphate synthase